MEDYYDIKKAIDHKDDLMKFKRKEKIPLTSGLDEILKFDDLGLRQLEEIRTNAVWQYVADVILVDIIAEALRKAGGIHKLTYVRLHELFAHGRLAIRPGDVDGIEEAMRKRYQALRRLIALDRR